MNTVLSVNDFQKFISNETNKFFTDVEQKDYKLDIKRFADAKLDQSLFDSLPQKFQVDILTANDIKKLLVILKSIYYLPLYVYKSDTYVKYIQSNSIIHGNRKIVTKNIFKIDVPASSKVIMLDVDTAGRNISFMKCYLYRNNSDHQVKLTEESITAHHKRYLLGHKGEPHPYFVDFILSRICGKIKIKLIYVLEEHAISVTPIRVMCTYTSVSATDLSKFLLESIDNKTRINYHMYSKYCIIDKKIHESNWKSYKIQYDIYGNNIEVRKNTEINHGEQTLDFAARETDGIIDTAITRNMIVKLDYDEKEYENENIY